MLFQRLRNATGVRYQFIQYNDDNFRVVKLKSAQIKGNPIGITYIWKPQPRR